MLYFKLKILIKYWILNFTANHECDPVEEVILNYVKK